MAKRERNKRSARKARQKERERVEVARAAATGGQTTAKKGASSKAKSAKPGKAKPRATAIAKADRKGITKVTGYFGDVMSELRKVTWPDGMEMRNYSVAVIATLIVFGIAIWLVDTGFVAGLVAFTGLRG